MCPTNTPGGRLSCCGGPQPCRRPHPHPLGSSRASSGVVGFLSPQLSPRKPSPSILWKGGHPLGCPNQWRSRSATAAQWVKGSCEQPSSELVWSPGVPTY